MSKDKQAGKGAVAAFERSPSHLLRRALQLSLDIYGEETGPGAITQRQYAVLAAVAAREGAAQTELVRITGIDRSTLAEMAARMIGRGLLERERSATDARANAVRLTEAGRETLEAAWPRAAAADARLLKLLSKGRRRDDLVDLLRELVRAGEALDGAPPVPAKLKPPKAAKPPKDGKKKRRKAERAASDADVEERPGA